MRISVRWAIGASLIAAAGLTSCTSKKVEASGYTEVELNKVARLRLPAQFQAIKNTAPAMWPDLKPNFIGDIAGAAEDQNFWAITNAFAFRENRDAQGKVDIPALLVVSRVADLQSFPSAQLFYDSAVRYSSDTRWSTPRRLQWKHRNISKSLAFFEAEIEPGKQGSTVLVMIDRENLLEALILGERSVLTPEAAQQVLEGLRTGYQVTQPLDDYFHEVNKLIQVTAEKRRKNYLALLEGLQKEELDYTPTPRVVVFNRNLSGQFWWPLFDRSGVPTHFALAGRLGVVRSDNPEAWKQLAGLYSGVRLVSAILIGGVPRWNVLSAGPGAGLFSLALLTDTRWAADSAEKQAYAAMEFSFTDGTPEISALLNALEAISRQAEAQGLVNPPENH